MTDPLAALRVLFIERCRNDLHDLRRFHDSGDLEEIGHLVHRLAGSAGSFGLPEISRLASGIDQQLRDSHGDTPVELGPLLAALQDLQPRDE